MKTLITILILCLSFSVSSQNLQKIKFESGKTYYVNGVDTITSSLFIKNLTNVSIIGRNNAKIVANYKTSGKIFDISFSKNFTLKNVELTTTDKTKIKNSIALWGSGGSKIINVKMSGGNGGVWSFDGSLYIDSCEVFDMATDGVFIRQADTVILKNTHVHDINTNYYKDQSEASAPGDNVQFDLVKYFEVSNNILDHSNAGNKFCFITGDEPGLPSYFTNNTCIGHPRNGALLYIIGSKDLTIKNNVFKGAPLAVQIDGNKGAKNLKIENNLFIRNGKGYGGIGKSLQTFTQNTFVNNKYGISGFGDTISAVKNIFYNTEFDIDGIVKNIYAGDNLRYNVIKVKTGGLSLNPMFSDTITYQATGQAKGYGYIKETVKPVVQCESEKQLLIEIKTAIEKYWLYMPVSIKRDLINKINESIK